MPHLIDVEVLRNETMLVVQRGDGTCTVSLPREAIERAVANALAQGRDTRMEFEAPERVQ